MCKKGDVKIGGDERMKKPAVGSWSSSPHRLYPPIPLVTPAFSVFS
jgi:hypothetical protein